MGNLMQGFINTAMTLAMSMVLLMAVISVVRAWQRAGGHVSVTVVGAVLVAGFIIWGVVHFTFLSDITHTEAEQLNNRTNTPLLESAP